MTYFVTKSLATGPIRFGASSRRPIEAIDDDPSFSTGPDGSFVRRRQESFFFADARYTPAATTPTILRRVSNQTFTEQILELPKPLLALVPIGAILIILGIAVLITKGAPGFIEIVAGFALIAAPVILTAQQRKVQREREARERAEHEERDKRNREMLASYTDALERMRQNPTRETMDAVGRERAVIDLPDPIWSPAARLAVLHIGLEALNRLGPTQAREVAKLMDQSAAAAGLHGDAKISLREDLYLVILWHLLADDRIGPAQMKSLEQLRTGFEVDVTEPAQEQFDRLRGIGVRNLPRAECTARLGFHEYCIYTGKNLFLTNKRLLMPSQKPAEIALPKIDDVTVDADTGVVTLRVAGLKKPLQLTIDDPIYTACLIDLASSLNERPRGFA